jgi:glycosyltransferase involved in cell wall biosynthesis
MHVLYIHQHFAVPSGSTGTRSYEFARRWVKVGHKVTLIAGAYDIGGAVLDNGLIQKQTMEGINVIVVGAKYGQKQSFLKRIASFLCFCFLSTYVGLKTKGVDVIFATSTPLTVGIPAMALKWLKRVPFVFEVRDQWPEIPIEMGIIKNKFMIKMLLWLEKTIYKNAAAIVALSPGMAEGVRDVIGKQKSVVIIPNNCDTELFHPDIDGSIIRKKYGWDNKFVFLHAGAMGRCQALDFVIEAAKKLTDNNDIHFVLIGPGSEKKRLAERVKQSGLCNLEILDSVPKAQLPEFFAVCDVSIVIFANYPILEHNSANKFFDSLSAGRPVLLNYSGWQRKILEDNGAGFGCSLYDLDEFVEKVLYFHSHREHLRKMGESARRAAEESFDRDKLAAEALSMIESVVEVCDIENDSYAK